jgi:hypothetical protein
MQSVKFQTLGSFNPDEVAKNLEALHFDQMATPSRRRQTITEQERERQQLRDENYKLKLEYVYSSHTVLVQHCICCAMSKYMKSLRTS